MGAATLAALVVTGVVAFSSWPDGAIRHAPESVRLADPAPSGDSGVALAVSAAASAAPEGFATLGAQSRDTPTQVAGIGVGGEAGSGNAPVAAAATPSPQSPAGVTEPPSSSRTADSVAEATVAAGEQVRQGINEATSSAASAADNYLPRTSEVLASMARNASQSTSVVTNTVAEVVRILPLDRSVKP